MFDFLSEQFSSFFSHLVGTRTLSERNMQESVEKVREALVQADVPHHVVEQFVAHVRADLVGKSVLKSLNPAEQFVKVVYDRLVAFLSVAQTKSLTQLPRKSVVMVCGLQGSGKTTTIAKLANYLKKLDARKRIACASLDFYRPAAGDQLAILAKQVGIDSITPGGTDVIQAARELKTFFDRSEYDVLLVDTAGRLHIDQTLLGELDAVRAIIKPTYVFLVLDAMTGQESLAVAQAFQDVTGFDGAILTKTDSDTRAGASFAFAYALKKPIVFIGTGEKIDELVPFYPERAAKQILGMGDLEGLLERADAQMSRQEQERSARAMIRGDFTLEDFAKQLDMMSGMGSLSQVMRMLPGMGGLGKIDSAQLAKGELEMKRFRVIMNSMTRKERQRPAIIDKSRSARIAKGAGVVPGDVAAMLEKFEQSKQFVKLLHKSGSFRKFF